MAREGGFVGERLGGGVISDSWIMVFFVVYFLFFLSCFWLSFSSFCFFRYK